MSKPKSSAVDSVVNNLVRAALGSQAATVADADLDKYVADLILKEASEKRSKYDQVGMRAYLPDTGAPPNTLPKPNKRFLANIVRATDEHNQALIKQAERDAAERRETIRRDNRRQRNYGYERDRERGRGRDKLRVDEKNRQVRSRSRSDSRLGSITRSTSMERRPLRDEGGRGSSYDEDYFKEPSSSLSRKPQRSPTSSPSVAATNSPTSRPNTPVKVRGRGTITDSVTGSQMDKYFRPDYDPRTDTTYAVDESGWIVDFSDFEASVGRPNAIGGEGEMVKNKTKKGKKRKKDKGELSRSGKKKKKKKRKRDSGTEDSSASESESAESDTSTDSEEDRRRRRRRRRHEEKKKRRSNKDDNVNKEEPKEVGMKVREWDMAKFANGEWSAK